MQNTNTKTSNMEPTTSNTNQTPKQNQNTYSNILKTESYPTKDHAIVIQKIENVEFNDHILELHKILNLNNITDAYPMSFGRICIYLKTKELANDIAEKHKQVEIKGHHTSLRKLVTATKRLMITVPANVPNNILLDNFAKHQIKITSPITRVKLANPALLHINSGRRQAYYLPNDQIPIPDSIIIDYENESHRIFLSIDKCEICNKHGYSKDRCKNITHTENTNQNQNKTKKNEPNVERMDDTETNTRKRTHTENNDNQETHNDQNNVQISIPPKKIIVEQIHSQTADNCNSNTAQTAPQIQNTTTAQQEQNQILTTELPTQQPTPPTQQATKGDDTKKTRTSITNIQNIIQTLKPIMEENPEKFPMEYSVFENFIIDTQRKEKIENIIKKYNVPSEHIVEMIQVLYNIPSQNRNIKTTLTKLKNKITSIPGYESSEDTN